MSARVAPQRMSTWSTWPVAVLVRRSWIGRRHALWFSATARTASRVVGWAIRSARVVGSVTRHHLPPGGRRRGLQRLGPGPGRGSADADARRGGASPYDVQQEVQQRARPTAADAAQARTDLPAAPTNHPGPPLVRDEEARLKNDNLSLTPYRDKVTLSMWRR